MFTKALAITITSDGRTKIVFADTDILEGTHIGVNKQQSNSLVGLSRDGWTIDFVTIAKNLT